MAEETRRRVLKFGGTSVGTPEALRQALAIVQDAARESAIVVVVSALSAVTDQLAALARGTGRGLDSSRVLRALRDCHHALLAAVAHGPTRQACVDFAATGALVADRLRAWPKGVVPIVTGFVGGTADGRTTVLGRGGSDYTAAILASALGAECVEVWTDGDGILSADPQLVDGAFTLARLSYDEALALATLGAKVLHPKTIPPLAESLVPVFVGNTRRREAAGTWVGVDRSWADGDGSCAETDSSSAETGRSWAQTDSSRIVAMAVASTTINGHARIGVLPRGRTSARHLQRHVLQVLADVHLAADPGPEAEGAAVTVLVDTEERCRAVRAIHAALVQPGAALRRPDGSGSPPESEGQKKAQGADSPAEGLGPS